MSIWRGVEASERTYIVLNGLVDEPDVGYPPIQALQAFVNVHTRPLQDEASVSACKVVNGD